MAYAAYGTAPRALNEFLRNLSPDETASIQQLSVEANSQYESEGLRRFTLTPTGVIDWTGIPVIAQAFAGDDIEAAQVFVRWARQHFPSGGEVVVLWGNFGIPSIKLPLGLATDRSNALFEVCDELWVFSPDAGIIIERYHEGHMTLAAVPAE
jgi:hypothetical protein